MFEQTVEQPIVRRGLSMKGWVKYLLFWLVVSIVLVIVFRHLSDKDARIAERERVVSGKIIRIHKGKGDPTDYTYQFQGLSYSGHDDGNFLDLTVGGAAKVFVDSQNPQTSGLRSFKFKSSLNRDVSTFGIYLSIGLAFVSAILWAKVLSNRDAENDEEHI